MFTSQWNLYVSGWNLIPNIKPQAKRVFGNIRQYNMLNFRNYFAPFRISIFESHNHYVFDLLRDNIKTMVVDIQIGMILSPSNAREECPEYQKLAMKTPLISLFWLFINLFNRSNSKMLQCFKVLLRKLQLDLSQCYACDANDMWDQNVPNTSHSLKFGKRWAMNECENIISIIILFSTYANNLSLCTVHCVPCTWFTKRLRQLYSRFNYSDMKYLVIEHTK